MQVWLPMLQVELSIGFLLFCTRLSSSITLETDIITYLSCPWQSQTGNRNIADYRSCCLSNVNKSSARSLAFSRRSRRWDKPGQKWMRAQDLILFMMLRPFNHHSNHQFIARPPASHVLIRCQTTCPPKPGLPRTTHRHF